MNPDTIGAAVHRYAPHTANALFLASVFCALFAIIIVYVRCRVTGADKHLPENWIVSIASVAAPVPTWCLLLVMPLDPDLSQTIFSDHVVVALAGLYGISAAFRDARAMATQSRKRKLRGDPPTDDE